MARILLINPSMDVAAGFGEYQSLMEPMPCIGIAYLAATCRAAGHEVRALDNFVEFLTVDQIVALARDWRADVVGLSMLTPSAAATEILGRSIKDALPQVRVVLGNLHASLFAKDLIESGSCDAVIHGEGERTFPMLIDALVNGGDPATVPGVSFANGNGVTETEQAPPIEDLDALPRPAWDLLPWRAYTFLPFVTVAKPCLAIMGSRGCPFRCTFCALGYMGNKVRRRSGENIADEVDWLVRDFGARHVGFVDPIFPLNKKTGIEICRAIRDKNIPGPWWWTSETRIDVVDEELCREMKQARCKRILFGIESGVDELLSRIGKKYTVQDVRKAVKAARSAELEISAFFMLALPGETARMTKQTIDFACSLDIDFAKFGITVPLPGSKLYDELVEQGKVLPGDWTRYSTFNPEPDSLPYVPEGMTGQTLQKLHRRATWRFYVRPKMIFRHLFVLRTIGLRQMINGTKILIRQWIKGRL